MTASPATTVREAQRVSRKAARAVCHETELWQVYEVDDPIDNRRGRVLIFETDAFVRRVQMFPVEWRALNDAELMKLSWGR